MLEEARLEGFKIVEYINPTPEEISAARDRFSLKFRDIKQILQPGSLANFESVYSGKARYKFLLLVYPQKRGFKVVFKNMALFCGKDFLLIFREKDRESSLLVQRSLSKIDTLPSLKEPTYIFLLFLETLASDYFALSRLFSKEIASVEKRLKHFSPLSAVERLSVIKRNLVFSHSSLKSLKVVIGEVVSSFSKSSKDVLERWESVSDTINLILEKVEDYDLLVDTLFRISETRLSTQINQTVKVLTLVQSLFLPATLISSIYGMNVNLPLAGRTDAFFILSGLMFLSTIALLLFLKKL